MDIESPWSNKKYIKIFGVNLSNTKGLKYLVSHALLVLTEEVQKELVASFSAAMGEGDIAFEVQKVLMCVSLWRPLPKQSLWSLSWCCSSLPGFVVLSSGFTFSPRCLYLCDYGMM